MGWFEEGVILLYKETFGDVGIPPPLFYSVEVPVVRSNSKSGSNSSRSLFVRHTKHSRLTV